MTPYFILNLFRSAPNKLSLCNHPLPLPSQSCNKYYHRIDGLDIYLWRIAAFSLSFCTTLNIPIFHVSGQDWTVLTAAQNKKVLKMYVCSKVSNIWKKPSVIVQNKITPWTKEPRVGGKRNNNLLPKILSPQLCQLLYIFIVNWIQMWAKKHFPAAKINM